MRFSNVENIEFVEQFDLVNLGAVRSGSSGGGDRIPPNVKPNAIDDEGETKQGEAITIDVLDNDLDANAGDQLVVRGVDQPVLGSALINSNGQIVFNPGTDFDYLGAGESATVTFDYSVSNGGGSDTVTVTITINGEEDPTETLADEAITNEAFPVVIDVLANDSDPDAKDNPLSIASIMQTVAGVAINNGTDVTFVQMASSKVLLQVRVPQ